MQYVYCAAIASLVACQAHAELTDAATTTGSEAPIDTRGDGVLPPMVLPDFLVGYNEAWFGDNYSTDMTTNFDLDYVDRTLDGIVAANGHVVRLFLFEFAEGITWNMTDPAPRIGGVSPALIANLDVVLAHARARGLWVYLTGLSAYEASRAPEPYATFFHDLYNNTSGELDKYETLVLGPVLDVVNAHKDNIYAFDLVNEIEDANNANMFADRWAAPRAFIAHMRTFVRTKSPWLAVTSSAGIGNPAADVALGFFSGLGLDFYDIHEYSDTGEYAGATSVCDRAASDGVFAILGEYGQLSERIDDNLQTTSTAAFLANSKRLCFKAAIAWRYDYTALNISNWFNFVRADGTYRPAVDVVRKY